MIGEAMDELLVLVVRVTMWVLPKFISWTIFEFQLMILAIADRFRGSEEMRHRIALLVVLKGRSLGFPANTDERMYAIGQKVASLAIITGKVLLVLTVIQFVLWIIGLVLNAVVMWR